ncbi:protein-disulfide reductase DsbD domain-containing protein [Prosthecobacter fusiformis]|nr:protein-disulfide reductase DsbD domain-containing protein [Prosthecobacter fusiformis]
MTDPGKVCSVQGSVLNLPGLWTIIILLLASLDTATAQTGLTLQLVPETSAIVPGQPFRVGLFIQHDPGWHTYWRQPGIVGVPTSIAWDLPAGFKAGELEFPEPESVLMFRIKAQGYERDVLLQTVITAPTDVPPGKIISLKGKATWMCCGNTCHPGHQEISLTMPVATEAQPDTQWQPLFEKERSVYARPSTAWTASAEEEGLKVTLILTPGPGARPFTPDEKVIFFTDDGWINSDEPQPQKLSSEGSLTLSLTRADVFLGKVVPEKLNGIVQRDGGWNEKEHWRSLIVTPKLKRHLVKNLDSQQPDEKR